MANTKTSDETAAAALTGAELFRGVQSAANVKVTGAQIKTLANTSVEATISASEIDWNNADTHYKTLGASTTFTFANAANGKQIVVAITGASTYTVTWPTVKWASGIAPTQSVGTKIDIYTFIQINSVIYGSYIQDMA